MEKPEGKPKKDRKKELVIEVYLFTDGSSYVEMSGLETLDLYDIHTVARFIDGQLEGLIYPKLQKHPWPGWPAYLTSKMYRLVILADTTEEKGLAVVGMQMGPGGTIVETWRLAATLDRLRNALHQYCARMLEVLDQVERVADSHYCLSLSELLDGTGVTPNQS